MRTHVHAPDGYTIPGSLCEQDGDTTIHQRDVDCPDCLDMMEHADWPTLIRSTEELRFTR
jgi:hypothetical protein